MTETPQYDCLTCGSCCHSQSPGQGYVLLSEHDQERLRPFSLPILSSPVQDSDPPEIVQMLGTKLDANGCKVCAAFTGVAGGVNACSIYEQRPGACRGFERGGYFCQEARKRFGLPV
jgi:Fe-S-cluster containining protein